MGKRTVSLLAPKKSEAEAGAGLPQLDMLSPPLMALRTGSTGGRACLGTLAVRLGMGGASGEPLSLCCKGSIRSSPQSPADSSRVWGAMCTPLPWGGHKCIPLSLSRAAGPTGGLAAWSSGLHPGPGSSPFSLQEEHWGQPRHWEGRRRR